ncbi:hypothetical protein SCG7086_AA_00190 [Chlamydiales bacterium SCGC AG-110-P3]|nr:hypothetical protein SCG7086_AA_00190 [Chlamydiales bacterium SCGC AG-110-P3]
MKASFQNSKNDSASLAKQCHFRVFPPPPPPPPEVLP